MSDKEIEETLKILADADTSTANYHLLEHEQKKALARIENKAPEWLKAQRQLIDSQAKEIERLRQSLVDSSYLIDRMVSDYPSEMWTHDEINTWKESGSEQVKDNNITLQEGSKTP
jgi:tRNA splicing endonuclease